MGTQKRHVHHTTEVAMTAAEAKEAKAVHRANLQAELAKVKERLSRGPESAFGHHYLAERDRLVRELKEME
jgi:hypothetical protein